MAIAYVTGIFMTAMDMHIVNVALPSLGRAFAAPLSDVQWTVIAYLLTLAVVIPASGWIGDRIGTTRTFIFALATFTAASALCGAADSLGELIAARALQGIGGGMLTPTGMAMLYRAYGPAQRARVARTLIIPILVAPGTAPILGGVLTQTLSWRWVFLVNIPVGVVMIVFSQLFLPRDQPSPGGRLDVRGLILSGDRPQRAPVCGQRRVGARMVLGADSGHRRRRPHPSGVPLPACHCASLIRSCGCVCCATGCSGRPNIVFALSTGPFLGSLYLTPIFLQEVLHQSPIASGTTTFVEAIGVGLAAQTRAVSTRGSARA